MNDKQPATCMQNSHGKMRIVYRDSFFSASVRLKLSRNYEYLSLDLDAYICCFTAIQILEISPAIFHYVAYSAESANYFTIEAESARPDV